jgi:L,D-peptidoglycan transpeptidase YkuD (ErfK/YbiS/YcfS/YnhG family)
VNSSAGTTTLYERVRGRWAVEDRWPSRNALDGWTTRHQDSDLRTPIGVFTLTDAGGELADPGTRLPYYQSDGFAVGGTGFGGERLAGSFDYVIAINYNRVTGTSPLDPRRPDGWDEGGGIWLHVGHGGATHGCVSLPTAGVVGLLRALDPSRHPVVVMGDREDLAK